MQNILRYLITALSLLALSNPVAANLTAVPQVNAPFTTTNPSIPVTEITTLLRPFSKKELLREADGWQSLVQQTARQIANAEIVIHRENLEIEQEDQLTEKIRHVQKQLEELMATKEKAQANQDVSAIPEIQQSIKEVQETMQEIEAIVEEFRKEHQKKDKATAEMSDESKATLGAETGSTTEDGGESVTERINQTVQSVETNTRKALDLLGNDKQEPTEMSEDPNIQAIIDRELATSIEMMEEVESITKAEKLRLLERIAELRRLAGSDQNKYLN